MKDTMKPFFCYIGGKQRLMSQLDRLLPSSGYENYYEPFLGSGAALLHWAPAYATVGDQQPEVINSFRVLRDVGADVLHEAIHSIPHTKASWDVQRITPLDQGSKLERASRFVWLTKTSYGGVLKVTRGNYVSGAYSYGHKVCVNLPNLRQVQNYLRTANVQLRDGSYEDTTESAKEGDFIFMDPPYDKLHSRSFSDYTLESKKFDQRKLKAHIDRLTQRGVKVMMTNANTPQMCALYSDYHVRPLHATRCVSADYAGRSNEAREIVVTNY